MWQPVLRERKEDVVCTLGDLDLQLDRDFKIYSPHYASIIDGKPYQNVGPHLLFLFMDDSMLTLAKMKEIFD